VLEGCDDAAGLQSLYVRGASVGATNWRGGVQATEHLLGLGHRRIAFVGASPRSTPGAERPAGFRSAMESAGLKVDPRHVIPGRFNAEDGLASRDILLGSDRPTAVFAASDSVALGVLQVAHEVGLRVPDDLSVIGFDDSYAAVGATPPLTTVRQPLGDVGRLAMRSMMSVIGGGAPITPHIELATTLVQRGSTAAVPTPALDVLAEDIVTAQGRRTVRPEASAGRRRRRGRWRLLRPTVGSLCAMVTPGAQTPPMGWNSWDCFGTSVTEAEVLANAEFMAERLLPLGWDTVVVDIQWHDPGAVAGSYNVDADLCLDAYGRPVPAQNRFPSAGGGAGFGPLADRVHALGLRFGVHLMRGIPRRAVAAGLPVEGTGSTAADVADRSSTCDWNGDNIGIDHEHPDAQAYYDSVCALLAQWGVDFVKVDDMLGPYHEREIEAFSRAVRGCGRPMVLSLSPGRELSVSRADHLRAHADMWRVSDDLWDRWEDVHDQFARMASWAGHAGPGSWPDADMLPLGHIGIRAERGPERQSRLTPDEQRTMMTLWCVSRSPLMLGGHLPSTSDETLRLLTNDEVLAVHRASSGNREVMRHGDQVIWTARAEDRQGRYLAAFNLGPEPTEVVIDSATVGARSSEVRDLWRHEPLSLGADGSLALELPSHGSALLHIAARASA
jgi:alpha-galactosidase